MEEVTTAIEERERERERGNVQAVSAVGAAMAVAAQRESQCSRRVQQ